MCIRFTKTLMAVAGAVVLTSLSTLAHAVPLGAAVEFELYKFPGSPYTVEVKTIPKDPQLGLNQARTVFKGAINDGKTIKFFDGSYHLDMNEIWGYFIIQSTPSLDGGDDLVETFTYIFEPPPFDLLFGIGLDSRIGLPDLRIDAVNFLQTFVFVDLGRWFSDGGEEPVGGSRYTLNNGTSPDLPGVMVGLSPIILDPDLGPLNPSPWTGDVVPIGVIGLAATISEPSTLILFFAGICIFGMNRTRTTRLNKTAQLGSV